MPHLAVKVQRVARAQTYWRVEVGTELHFTLDDVHELLARMADEVTELRQELIHGARMHFDDHRCHLFVQQFRGKISLAVAAGFHVLALACAQHDPAANTDGRRSGRLGRAAQQLRHIDVQATADRRELVERRRYVASLQLRQGRGSQTGLCAQLCKGHVRTATQCADGCTGVAVAIICMCISHFRDGVGDFHGAHCSRHIPFPQVKRIT